MKRCFKCGLIQAPDAFYLLYGRLASPCKSCRKTYSAKKRAPIRAAVLQKRIARKQLQAELAQLLRMRRRLVWRLKWLRTKKFWEESPVSRWNKYRSAYRKTATHKQDKALRKRGRIPAFANRKVMRLIYRKRKEWSAILGYELHVDHIVPMNHARVSGLHCEANLQLLADAENNRKSNLFWPDCPWES